jgi:MoaA/NifB/PqqE/SkfB family radical SAM enzyme
MDCLSQEALTHEFLLKFQRKLYSDRIPISGSMDLTTRCNFNCIHCYLPETARSIEGGHREMDTRRILGLIDDIADAGCLNLLFTGVSPCFGMISTLFIPMPNIRE